MNIENIILNSNYWLFLTTKKSFSKKVYTSFNGKREKCTITKEAFKNFNEAKNYINIYLFL